MNSLVENWLLDPQIHFLNHGSFGACPRLVLEHQQRLRSQMELQPVSFMQRQLPIHLEEARARVGTFVGAAPDDLAFVTNATSGVNAVLRSLELTSSDELLVTDHAYPACRKALEFVAARTGASIEVVTIPLNCTVDEIVGRISGAATKRTRLLVVDHISSATAVIFPVAQIVAEMNGRDIDTLVDGAHAPGMLELALDGLGAAYYTGNCHKWMCAPKGAAFLYVRPDRQGVTVPSVISSGFDPTRHEQAFRAMFDWTGTADPTAALSVEAAIETVGALVPEGWVEVMQRNRSLVAAGAHIVAEALGEPRRTPSALSGSMVAFELPGEYPVGARWDPLQDKLLFEHRVEVPIVPWPQAPKRLLRISAHLYNDLDDYRALAVALKSLL